MIAISKIFRFEAAHAIDHYPGSCSQIHGHSYQLQVAVKPNRQSQDFIPGLGMVMDFKVLKSIVQDCAIRLLDHKLLLSKSYLAKSENNFSNEELVIFDFEPTAENLLRFLKMKIVPQLPQEILLVSLKLWETHDSFAEWSAG